MSDTLPAEVLSAEVLPANGLLGWSWLLIALPLAGAAVLLLGGRRTDRWGHLLGVATVGLSFVLGLACTIQLAGKQVSRQHAHLYWHGDHYLLEDLGSSNGTYVNGKRTTPRTPGHSSSTDSVLSRCS